MIFTFYCEISEDASIPGVLYLNSLPSKGSGTVLIFRIFSFLSGKDRLVPPFMFVLDLSLEEFGMKLLEICLYLKYIPQAKYK